MDEDTSLDSICKVCGRSATSRCSKCLNVYYCGKKHQTEDWKLDHKLTCKCWIKDNDEKHGVQYKAARDLKAGVRIFDRKAILAYPRKPLDIELKSLPIYSSLLKLNKDKYQIYPCLGCYQLLAYKCLVKDPKRGWLNGCCPKCEWPVHSPSCEDKHESECKILTSNKIKWSDFLAWYESNSGDNPEVFTILLFIGVLRAIVLKIKYSPDWKILMAMPFKTHKGQIIYSDQANRKVSDSDFDQQLRNLKHFISNSCKLTNIVSLPEIEKVCRILLSNSYRCNDFNRVRAKLCSIIFEGSQGRILPHSCIPNSMVFIHPETLTATFRTILPVKAGEILTISYHDICTQQGQYKGLTMRSRSILLQCEYWCDPCTCPRCSDGTENGTMFSAVCCTQKNCDGYLLPNDTTSIKQDSIWSCNSTKCRTSKILVEVEEIVIQASRELGQVRHLGNEELINSTIKGFAKFLHPNHYKIFTSLYLEIVSPASYKIANPESYLSVDSSKKFHACPSKFAFHKDYLKDINFILDAMDKLTPGRTPARGYLEYIKSLLLISELTEKVQSQPNEMIVEFLNNNLAEFQRTCKVVDESLALLKMNPLMESEDITHYRGIFNIYLKNMNDAVLNAGLEDMELVPKIYRQDFDLRVENFTLGNLFSG